MYQFVAVVTCFNGYMDPGLHSGRLKTMAEGGYSDMVTALISLLGVLIFGSVAASFILALIELDEIDEVS